LSLRPSVCALYGRLPMQGVRQVLTCGRPCKDTHHLLTTFGLCGKLDVLLSPVHSCVVSWQLCCWHFDIRCCPSPLDRVFCSQFASRIVQQVGPSCRLPETALEHSFPAAQNHVCCCTHHPGCHHLPHTCAPQYQSSKPTPSPLLYAMKTPSLAPEPWRPRGTPPSPCRAPPQSSWSCTAARRSPCPARASLASCSPSWASLLGEAPISSRAFW